MILKMLHCRVAFASALVTTACVLYAQAPPPNDAPAPDAPRAFGGSSGGFSREERKLVKQFDKDNDKRLNAEERKAAREFLAKERASGNDRPRGMRGPGPMRGEAPKPGVKISPADVKSVQGAPLYASNVVRTLFIDFENGGWEKELSDFHGTDVEVPARLTVDGKTYPDVGIHFRGASSYGMVGEGSKRSLNLSLDDVRKNQSLLGHRTLNLLNSHGDPSFFRSVLFYQVAREYIPAPRANLVRVVINGENWGVYVSIEQFNKDFVQEWFGTTKGARWKVPGSPGGRGSLAYLGEDAALYKKIYEIKSKDEPKSWADLIKLCKVLNETPSNKLEQAIVPLLDIDGALKFLALDNALINNDGYWVRTSDYDIYQDEKGRFHILPQDANETFTKPGGPGFGGRGGFGSGTMIASRMFADADGNADRKLTCDEFTKLAEAWFNKLDATKSGKVTQEQFAARLNEIMPPPQGFGGPPGGGQFSGGGAPPVGGGDATRGPGGRGGFGMAAPLFTALDANKDSSITSAELKNTFNSWFTKWDTNKTGALSEDALRSGLTTLLPAGPGGPGGGANRGGRGPGNPVRVNGVELDPLAMANDAEKPLISKLLAVPALRERYLGNVRDIADKWLDWNRLGPIAEQYHSLIAEHVKADTRKLSS
ncbi:MAG TPA: CotH kinase family protein, partial [Candidatus Acidoferrum sp.]|nr:CotH kinase family protein [Candidatus Acidoferrum sp.]